MDALTSLSVEPPARRLYRDGWLSVIVRVHDPSRLEMLDLALFSLACQGYGNIEVLVCCQGFSEDALAAVRGLIEATVRPPGSEWRVLNLVCRPGDHRAALINLGIGEASGRYLAFLDFDDVVYAGAYAFLIDKLRADERAAVAFGRIHRVDTVGGGAGYYALSKRNFDNSAKLAFFAYNIFPIHSAVIDRSRVSAADLRFNEDMGRLEDYEFYLRLLGNAHWLDLRDRVKAGEYLLRSDGSNSVDEDRSSDAWQRAERYLAATKAALRVPVPANELAALVSRSMALGNVGGSSVGGREVLSQGEAGMLRRYRRRRRFVQRLIDRVRGKSSLGIGQ